MSLQHLYACNLKSPYRFCKSTLFSLLYFDVNDYSRQMPVFSALVLVCLRKFCQACSAICSCSDAILPFFSRVINNPGHIILCTPQEPRGRRGEGIWSPYVTSKVMHIVARGKGEEVSEHLEQRSGGQS